MGLQVTDKYLENIPDKVININTTTLCGMYWLSHRTILANQPDIVLHDKRE